MIDRALSGGLAVWLAVWLNTMLLTLSPAALGAVVCIGSRKSQLKIRKILSPYSPSSSPNLPNLR